MDGVICKPRDNWRLLEELDGVFAHDDSWRRHQNDKFKFVLTRMRIQRTQAGYVCFKFAGGLQIHGRKNDDDDEFTVVLALGCVLFDFYNFELLIMSDRFSRERI